MMNVRPSTPLDACALTEEVVACANEAYERGEGDLWGPGWTRTNKAEMAGLLARGEMLLARREDGTLAGCVQFERRIAPGVARFGLLAVAPAFLGQGMGSLLVQEAERRAKADGATSMRLEVLAPLERPHADKDKLKAWYSRLGYVEGPRADFADKFPHLASCLAEECKFQTFNKPL